MFSERKPSHVSQAISTSQFSEEIQNQDLVIFLRAKVSSLEKELEKMFLKHQSLIEKMDSTNTDRVEDFAKTAEISYLKKESSYLKKALLWRKQEMDLFESKFRAFSINKGNHHPTPLL